MIVELLRHAYLSDRTMGRMKVADEVFFTIERPWLPSPNHLGGENFKSCVPDGHYSLRPFDSDNHHNCYSINNPDLDVYINKPNGAGRWAILIHPGNYVKDVVGCIAPGMTSDEEHVWNSRAAMDRIRAILGQKDHELIIRPKGARNGNSF